MAGFVVYEDLYFIAQPCAAGVSGDVFLALNRIVELLERIAGPKESAAAALAVEGSAEPAAVRTIADIEADLKRLNSR